MHTSLRSCAYTSMTHKLFTHCRTVTGSRLRSESGAWPDPPSLVNTIVSGVNATRLSTLHTASTAKDQGPCYTSGNKSRAAYKTHTELTYTLAKRKVGKQICTHTHIQYGNKQDNVHLQKVGTSVCKVWVKLISYVCLCENPKDMV